MSGGGPGPRRWLLFASLLSCVNACSSEKSQFDGGGGTFTKIDDMEGDIQLNGNTIQWPPPPGLEHGVWWSATDCTAVANILPPPYLATPNGWSYEPLAMPVETLPAVTSRHAARLRTTAPLVGIWGAEMGLNLATMPGLQVMLVPPPSSQDGGTAAGSQACPTVDGTEGSVDLSLYSGITFWAMGAVQGARQVKVQLQDRNTDSRGGMCNVSDVSSPDYCFNGFATKITLTNTFRQYTISFSDLRQDPTWGHHADPDILDVQHVYSLGFEVDAQMCNLNEMCAGGAPPALTFDMWVDDLYFVNK